MCVCPVAQWLTLCDPMDCSPSVSSVHGISQARTLEWVHACAKLLQLCPTLCDPMDCSPSGSSVHGISQARILEWVATPSSRGSSWPRDRTCVSSGSSLQADSLPQSHGGSPPFWIPEDKQDQTNPCSHGTCSPGGKSLQKKLHRNSQQNQTLVAYEVPEGGLRGWCFVITLLNIHAET